MRQIKGVTVRLSPELQKQVIARLDLGNTPKLGFFVSVDLPKTEKYPPKAKIMESKGTRTFHLFYLKRLRTLGNLEFGV